MVLVLKRTPTVYSLSQLGEGESAGTYESERPSELTGVAAPLCPVSQIRSSHLPLYSFPSPDGFSSKRIRSFGDLMDSAPAVPDMEDPLLRGSSDEEYNPMEGSSDSGSSAQVVPQRSILDSLLLAEWEDRAEQGLFRYDVTACPTRVLDGVYGFVAQLNEGRASKKRPTEFCVDLVDQPFDGSKFNFCKALQREVLFQFHPGGSKVKGPSFSPAAPVASAPNLVFINVSPIEYGHVLLVPRALDNLNQLVAPDTLLLALQFAREANNPYLRVGYNSLGAYATINHLHFQAYYLAAPMALERAPSASLPGVSPSLASTAAQEVFGTSESSTHRNVRVCKITGYPVRGLVFEAGDSLREMANMIGVACQRLTACNIPHNVMIVDSGARVFLLPNIFAERKARNELPEDIMATQVDPAVFEICGHIVLKRQQDYAIADQEWTWRLLEYASVSEERFADIVDICLRGG